MSLTFLIEAVVSSIKFPKAVVSTPGFEATSEIALALIKFKSSDFVKSNFLSAAEADELPKFPALVLTTSTTEFRAASNASFSFAPAPLKLKRMTLLLLLFAC